MGVLWRALVFFPQQQNGMGSLHNVDFGVFWVTWPGSGKEPGSGNRFRVQFPEPVLGNRSGFRRLGSCIIWKKVRLYLYYTRLDHPQYGTVSVVGSLRQQLVVVVVVALVQLESTMHACSS